jgi:hypothetical protein
VPSPRQSQPRTPAEVLEMASALKKENPGRSAARIRRILSAQHGWAPDERTLQRMFVRTGLNLVARSVCGLVRITTVLSRCDRGADEKWRRQSSEYGPVNARRHQGRATR